MAFAALNRKNHPLVAVSRLLSSNLLGGYSAGFGRGIFFCTS